MKLFTIAEVSRACGISRTSLIRLEESGFFKPCRIDPDTGYRYYDVNNMIEIGRYKRLQVIGLTRSEITEFYHDRIDFDRFMETQRQKLNLLQQFVDEFELRHTPGKHHYSLATLPDMTCRSEDIFPSSFKEAEHQGFMFFEKVAAEGFRMIPEQPPFLISDNWSALKLDSPSEGRFTVCIPVIPEPDRTKDTRLRHFPGSKAISVCGFGGYSILPELISKLYDRVSENRLEIADPLRFIPLTANVVTRDNYIIKLILPVKDI